MNGHAQTLIAHFTGARLAPGALQETILLPDGDALVIETDRPASWQLGDQLVVLVHGLAGSSRSGYMLRVSQRLTARGVLCVRMNLRGAGLGASLARLPYHSGLTSDLRAVLDHVRCDYPASQVSLIGFSLGGNVVLKWASEAGQHADVHQVITVSPPVDLYASVQILDAPSAQIYRRSLVSWLVNSVRTKAKHFTDLEVPHFPRGLLLQTFDALYTAPVWGFENERAYYEAASAAPVLSQIRVPTHVLYAKDDPMIDTRAWTEARRLKNIKVYGTPGGGHMGFLGRPFSNQWHRMDDWIASRCLGT